MSITKLDCMELKDTRYSVYPYDGYNLEEILGKFYEGIKECNDLSFSLQEFNNWIIAEGLQEEVLKQLKKVDWNNVINSELYQTIVERLLNTNNRIEEVKNEIISQLETKAYKTYVTYKEFGAKLNGVDDDTQYIKACHDYANEHGLKVIQQNSKIVLSSEIEVRTDLDLTGSVITTKLIDVDVPYHRTKSLYKITGNPLTSVDVVGALTQGNRDLNISYNGYVAIMGNDVYMKRYNLGTESNVLNWESNYINNKKLTYPLINNHTNFTLSIREDDIPLNIKGCRFITEYNLSKALSLFSIERNNVTIENVQLNTVGEGNISPLYTIVNVSKCCNTVLNNIQCDKMSNADGNGLSYFILLEMCNNITINNCKQGRISWSGVNGNFIRDVKANNCELFMYGCHAFGTDMSIKNSKIYGGIQIHGTGELNIEDCIFYDSGITNRLDYGGEFRGTWNIKNCKAYNIQRFIYLAPPNYNHGKICGMPNINIDGLYFETTKNNNNIVYLGYLDNQTFESYLCKDIKIKNVVVETNQAHRTFEIIYPLEKNLFNEMNLTIDNLKINKSNYITQGWYAEYANIQIPAIIDNTVLNVNVNNSVANFGVRGTRNVNVNVNNSEVLMLRESTNYIQTNGIMNMTIQNSVITRPYCNLTRTSVNLVSMNNIFKKGTDGVIGNGFAECVKLAKNNICEVGANIREQDKQGLYNYVDTSYWTNS